MILTIILVVVAIAVVLWIGNRQDSSKPVETPSTDMSKVCPKDCMDCVVVKTPKKAKATKKVATKKVTKVTKKTK
jgi:hypothetical protein